MLIIAKNGTDRIIFEFNINKRNVMTSNNEITQVLDKVLKRNVAANDAKYECSRDYVSSTQADTRLNLTVAANDPKHREALTDTSIHSPPTEFRVKRLHEYKDWVYVTPSLEPHLYPEPIEIFRQRLADRLRMTQEELWQDIEYYFGHRRGIRVGVK